VKREKEAQRIISIYTLFY